MRGPVTAHLCPCAAFEHRSGEQHPGSCHVAMNMLRCIWMATKRALWLSETPPEEASVLSLFDGVLAILGSG